LKGRVNSIAWVLSGNILGPQGPAGVGVRYRGTEDTIADLPLDVPPGTNAIGDMWIVTDEPGMEGHAQIWDGSTWEDAGPWLGPEGPQGVAGARGSRWDSGALTATDLNTTPLAGQLVNDHYLHTSAGANLGSVYRLDP